MGENAHIVSESLTPWALNSAALPVPLTLKVSSELLDEPGVYVCEYANGTTYVGKAVQVNVRLSHSDHKQREADNGPRSVTVFYTNNRVWNELLEQVATRALLDEGVELLNSQKGACKSPDQTRQERVRYIRTYQGSKERGPSKGSNSKDPETRKAYYRNYMREYRKKTKQNG